MDAVEAFDMVFNSDQLPEEQSIALYVYDAMEVLCKHYVDWVKVEALRKCFLLLKFIVLLTHTVG